MLKTRYNISLIRIFRIIIDKLTIFKKSIELKIFKKE
jgi:hypothetical protein